MSLMSARLSIRTPLFYFSQTRTAMENSTTQINEVPAAAAGDTQAAMVREEEPKLDPEIEAAREGVEQHPPMTFKRFMAIFSLGCLLAETQIPLYLIGGSLGILLSTCSC